MSLMTGKLNQWGLDHALEGGKGEDGVEMLDRLIQHRLRMIDPQAAKLLQVCKDWHPAHGVPSPLLDAVRSLILWLEGSNMTQITAPNCSGRRASSDTPRRRRLSAKPESKAGAPAPQYSARTVEQNEETVDLFRSFVLAKLCDYFQHFMTGVNPSSVVTKGQRFVTQSKVEEASAKAPITVESWKCLLENVGLLNWTCCRPRLPWSFKKFCEDRRIIDTLAHLVTQSPNENCACVLPVLNALRTYVCGKEATEDLRMHRSMELTNADFFGTLKSHMGSWTSSALDLPHGVHEADHLLSCIGDMVRELLRHQSGCDAAENGDFVPSLHKIINDRLLSEPLLWPRASMLLMDAIEAIPKADYVQCGLDLSKTLRRMRSAVPTSDVSAIPSLLVLRLGELRRSRQCKDRRNLLRQRLAPRASSCQGHRKTPRLPSREASAQARTRPANRMSPPMTPNLPSVPHRPSSDNPFRASSAH